MSFTTRDATGVTYPFMSSMSDSDSPDWYPATPSSQPSKKARKYEKYLADGQENFVDNTIAIPELLHAHGSYTISGPISSAYVPWESQGSVDLFGSCEMTFSNSDEATESPASSRKPVLSVVQTQDSPMIEDLTPPIFNPEEGFNWDHVPHLSSEAYPGIIKIHGDVKPPSSVEYNQLSWPPHPDKKPILEINNFVPHEELEHIVTGNSVCGLGSLEPLETDKGVGEIIESPSETPMEDSELFDLRAGTDSTHYSSPESSHSWLGVEEDSQDFGSEGSLSPLLPDRETYLAEEEKMAPRLAKIQQQHEDHMLARRISRGLDPLSQMSLRSRSSQGPNLDSSSCLY